MTVSDLGAVLKDLLLTNHMAVGTGVGGCPAPLTWVPCRVLLPRLLSWFYPCLPAYLCLDFQYESMTRGHSLHPTKICLAYLHFCKV